MLKINLEICICTYKRKNYLTDLLDSIYNATIPVNTNLGIIVVDNDPDKSALNIIENFKKRNNQIKIKYFHEKNRGISFARNRSIKEAINEKCEVIAFLDDDETIKDNWIEIMIRNYMTNPEKIILGSVTPVFEETPPLWIKNSTYYHKPKAPLTANALFSINKIKHMDYPLDKKYALTGGSDTHLKIRLLREGSELLYVKDAEVFEKIPLSRANGQWILNRAFRTGYTAALIEKDLFGFKGVLKRIVIITLRIIAIPVMLTRYFSKNKKRKIDFLININKIKGNLYGLINGEYYEYQKTHGN
ncbi:glycosyltransferase family 2 protein [Exiguobacterium acetylicum]|uniref:glycosyltransferase family 2 protein n=1 Tax=Exiguobacterium acetylicum TaxID=41170 RepID=UPI001CA615AD|nr:glycosyltransferase family 2 protein [Exiguobacterium acetylicum]QZY86424.1 glycosyltransferase [Exiguobacterium acetylicum]